MESLNNILLSVQIKFNWPNSLTTDLEGLNSISVNWGGYFAAHQINIPFAKLFIYQSLSMLSFSTEACLDFKYMLRECVCCPPWWLCWHHTPLLSLYLLISANQQVSVSQLKSCIFTGNDHHGAAGWDHIFSYCGSLYHKGRWRSQQAQTDHHHWRR